MSIVHVHMINPFGSVIKGPSVPSRNPGFVITQTSNRYHINELWVRCYDKEIKIYYMKHSDGILFGKMDVVSTRSNHFLNGTIATISIDVDDFIQLIDTNELCESVDKKVVFESDDGTVKLLLDNTYAQLTFGDANCTMSIKTIFEDLEIEQFITP